MAQKRKGVATRHFSLDVHKVGGSIGAVVDGVRIGVDLPSGVLAELREALLRHRVIFLRGQEHASDSDQHAFAAQLGPVTLPHPTVRGDDASVLPIDAENGKANSWHTDVTFVDRVPAISVLRAVTLPPYGGTTVWANTVAAYEQLPSGLKALAGELRAVHSNKYDYAAQRARIGGVDVQEEAYRKEFVRQVFETEHPVVRVHPETGEPSLLLGHFAAKFVGYSTADFNDLYAVLQRHITRLENTVRWSWQPGDVAIWDNRATQHYAVADYDDHPRRLHRITVAGDVPVGLDGVASTVLVGDATHYSELAA